MTQTLLEMAKDLVMAQIEAHRLSPEEMHTALQHTYASLKALQAQEDANGRVAVVPPETPAEPVKGIFAQPLDPVQDSVRSKGTETRANS